jgi:hypothetical protein
MKKSQRQSKESGNLKRMLRDVIWNWKLPEKLFKVHYINILLAYINIGSRNLVETNRYVK